MPDCVITRNIIYCNLPWRYISMHCCSVNCITVITNPSINLWLI
nr:MAG TPA: hypothetical protein [Caudoviricetes sp.]